MITLGDTSILEGKPDTRLLESPEDVVYLVSSCFEHEARAVLLYAENLSEYFFDLSSGEAGTILQKFRTYNIKLAVVTSRGGVRQTERFKEMVREEGKGQDFRVFENREAAEAWLAEE